MKPMRSFTAIALLFVASAAWAQNNGELLQKLEQKYVDVKLSYADVVFQNGPDSPNAVRLRAQLTEIEAMMARERNQRVNTTYMGPGPVVFRARTAEGPQNATFGPVMNPGPDMGMGEWWKNSETVAKLQLSEEVVRKIEQTFLDHQLKLIDLRAELEKQELRLQPLLDADRPDTGKVGAQIDLISAARGRLEKENAMMRLAIRSELTIEQWKKLKSLQETDTGKKVFFFRRELDGPPPGSVSLPGPPQPPGDLPKFWGPPQ